MDILTTDLKPGEVLTEIRFPADPPDAGTAYLKLHQPAFGFALVGVAARVLFDEKGKCREARVGITGVASKAFRAVAAAAAHVVDGVEPLSDLHASGPYRAEMARVYVRRALELAFGRARGPAVARGPKRAAMARRKDRPRPPTRGKRR